MSVVNIVKTVSGKEIEKKFCVTIGGEFYEKNVDCYNIDGRWYRKGNPKIYFNSVTNAWAKITPNTVSGIISKFEYDNSYTLGLFEKSFDCNYSIETDRGTKFVANRDLFMSIPKIWDNNRGKYFDLKYAVACGINSKEFQKGRNYIYSFDRMYNSESLIPRFSAIDNSKYCNSLLDTINAGNKKFPLFDKYSFGLEIETSGGLLPEHRCVELGLIPLRDGSIGGHEYTTIPMRGKDGINLLMNQLEEIKELCSINKECSLHIHFGGFELTEAKILKLYNTFYALQNEIGSMFPRWIYNTSQYKAGGKDYCKKLPCGFNKIEDLYYYLSEDRATWSGSFTKVHPQDPNREQKWNNHMRYAALNIINLLFDDKAKTAEFRMHTPTFNYTKVLNWMFICTAILNYAENSCEDATTLLDVLKFSYDDSTTYILGEYIETRKKYFAECSKLYGDSCGALDIMHDNEQFYKTPYHS